MVPQAGIFPAELTALRSAGLLIGAAILLYAIARRRALRNVDVLILLAAGLGLALVSGTEITDKLLSAFSFEKGNGGRILGLAVFAIFILFFLILQALSQAPATRASSRRRWRAWPGRSSGRRACPSVSATRSRSSSPPTTRPRTSATSSSGCRPRSAACDRDAVVDDGSRDGTGDAAAEHGAAVARHVATAAAARRCGRDTG